MAKKIFAGFLGTGPYSETVYYLDESELGNNEIKTKYIQEYLIRKKCSEWGNDDKIVFFLTKDARAKHWESDGGLKNQLDKLNLETPITTVDITKGSTEEELWEIFDQIANEFNDKDEVIFDITHGFRSLPTFAIPLIDYLKVTKHIKLKGVYYGAYERDRDNNPVFDLSSIDNLQEWSKAVFNFVNNGITTDISNLLKITNGDFNEVARNLNKFSESISVSNLNEILTFRFQDLIDGIKRLKRRDDFRIEPIKPLFDEILNKIKPFNTTNIIERGLCCVKWCIDYGLIQQGYTMLSELISIYYIQKLNNANSNNHNYRRRDYRRYQDKKDTRHDVENYYNNNDNNIIATIANNDLSNISQNYGEIHKIRSGINHGSLGGNLNTVQVTSQLATLYNRIKKLISPPTKS